MFEELFGSKTAEGVIIYLSYLGSGHGQCISEQLSLSQSQVDRTLKRLEAGSIIVGKLVGRARVFEINPRLPIKKELIALVDKMIEVMPEREREKYIERRRPRRTGKKL